MDSIKVSIQSGAPAVDIWWLSSMSEFIDAYSAGLLQNLDNMKVFNFSDRTRYTAGTDIAMINGIHYGVAPNTYSFYRICWSNVLYANNTVLKSAGVNIDDLYKLQKDGNWTWDEYEKVMARVSQAGKIPMIDMFDSNNLTGYQTLLNSNKGDWLLKSGNTVSFGANTSEAKTTLDKYVDWSKKGYVNFGDGDPAKQKNKFTNGEAAFMFHSIQYPFAEAAVSNKLKNVDFSIMYAPKGPSASDYVAYQNNYSYASIPKGVKKPNEVATVLDAINTSIYTAAEEKTLLQTDCLSRLKNQGSIDTLAAIHSKGAPPITWTCLAQGLLINHNTKKDGWYDLVRQVADGSLSHSAALEKVSTWNNLLSNVYTTR
jgi:ABC-type glycerol-3-phosphate transport system substrate-binding protein